MFVDPKEEKARIDGKFSYNMDDFHFFESMNSGLISLEEKLMLDCGEIYPNIFISGITRSGTTLASQIIYNNLNIGCVNNLMAKFWHTPLCGAKLSKIVIGDNKIESYKSSYGKIDTITSPHEFGYFWKKHCVQKDISYSYPPEIERNTDWANVKKIILNMNRILEKGMMFKTMELTGYFLQRFHNIFEKSIFIHTRRNALDTACSIAKGRIEHYNSLDRWWGGYPVEYKQLLDLPYEDQIAGQIYYMDKSFMENIQSLNSERVICIDYNDLCSQPEQFLNKVVSTIKTTLNIELKQTGSPSPFVASVSRTDNEIKQKLVSGLSKYGL